MIVTVMRPVFYDGAFRKIGDLLELDCSYATMPRWCVEYRPRATSSGAPDRRHTFERKSRRAPPREPLKVEKDYVEASVA